MVHVSVFQMIKENFSKVLRLAYNLVVMVVKRPRPDFSIETHFKGLICGIDEAGRGSLAGPVVAAAVILDQGRTPDGITDSKLLTQVKREHLFRKITTQASIAVGFSEVEEIDKINILNGTLAAMERAVDDLTPAPAVALVDGNCSPKLDCSVHTVIGGDRLSLSIAAASIVAKVTRDRLMMCLARACPGYGWEHNAGYATSEHLEALASHGVTPHHRRSFAPVARASRPTN